MKYTILCVPGMGNWYRRYQIYSGWGDNFQWKFLAQSQPAGQGIFAKNIGEKSAEAIVPERRRAATQGIRAKDSRNRGRAKR